jgi:hypothetical protein
MKYEDTEKIIAEIQSLYRSIIQKKTIQMGGMENLSRSLNLSKTFVNNTLRRDSFSALRRLCKKIMNGS